MTRLCDLSVEGDSVTSVGWSERVSILLLKLGERDLGPEPKKLSQFLVNSSLSCACSVLSTENMMVANKVKHVVFYFKFRFKKFQP